MSYSVYWLAHHGIKGQKWGIRRFQNEDGSLTEEGRKRYNQFEERFNKIIKDSSLTQKQRFEKIGKAQDEIESEYKQKLGKDTYNRITDVFNKVVYGSFEGDYSEYNGIYKKDLEELRAQRDAYTIKQSKMALAFRAEAEKEYKSLTGWKKAQAKMLGRDDYIYSQEKKRMAEWTSSKEAEQMRKDSEFALSAYNAKKQVASLEWKTRTLKDLVNSVPKDQQDIVFEMVRFNMWGNDK